MRAMSPFAIRAAALMPAIISITPAADAAMMISRHCHYYADAILFRHYAAQRRRATLRHMLPDYAAIADFRFLSLMVSSPFC